MAEADDWNTLQATAIKYLKSVMGGTPSTQEQVTWLNKVCTGGTLNNDLSVLSALVLTLLNRVYDLENP
jgi:hypothetical protein